MKILTILGTRPEIIRLSKIITMLDEESEHIVFHTNQNYTYSLNDVFFDQLGIRKPDHLATSSDSLAKQLSTTFVETERLINIHKPDKVLILGDTNSGLTAIVAERMGVPVYHMEAGNRCYDLKVPEEKNRKIIDAISSLNMPYTPGSKKNLLKEGINEDKIYVTGNPINEVMLYYNEQIEESKILEELGLSENDYIVSTFHRAENVDSADRLKEIINGLDMISSYYGIKIVCSTHPRTRSQLISNGFKSNNLIMLDPFGFFDFVKLEKYAAMALTDSGTVQEECCLLKVPTVTMRDTTERPETVECGSNVVSGVNAYDILKCFQKMIESDKLWELPIGYNVYDVSTKVVNKLMEG